MTDLNCYITTFNCGRAAVNVEHLSAHFFDGLKTNLPPDLVVLCLEEIASIGESFLGGSFLTPYFTRLTTTVHAAAAKRFESESDYVSVLVRNVGMTGLMVFARRSIEERVRWIETAGVGVGVWELGNKGAVAARLGLQAEEGETILTLVAAHLAPMEEAWEQRNEDWKKICEGLVFEREGTEDSSGSVALRKAPETQPLLSSTADASKDEAEHTLFSPISHVFFSGDLNYRTSDTNPKPEDFKTWSQSIDASDGMQNFDQLLQHDQLNRERHKGNTLHHLTESEITFPPTYKHSDLAQQQATRLGVKPEVGDEQHWLWAKHRVPSWCDRILYLEAAPPQVHAYTSLPVQPTSDHRPVVMSFSIPFKPVSGRVETNGQPFPIRKDWREARAAARRNEYIVGLAAYLTLTWEGEALLGGSMVGMIGGYLALRALIGT